jgi:alanine-alpha-ketoisovalerate/valine-pyruvate aminotransferase
MNRESGGYQLTIPEIQQLRDKKIRTTIPNIGLITATVGKYDSNTNRVELINIISEEYGRRYGNLTYLPS